MHKVWEKLLAYRWDYNINNSLINNFSHMVKIHIQENTLKLL